MDVDAAAPDNSIRIRRCSPPEHNLGFLRRCIAGVSARSISRIRDPGGSICASSGVADARSTKHVRSGDSEPDSCSGDRGHSARSAPRPVPDAARPLYLRRQGVTGDANAGSSCGRLTQEVAVAVDVSGEIERVLTSQPLRQLRIAASPAPR